MARNRVIGKDNRLPWHFSSDLKFFKKLTTGSTVIMGRRTFESIGKPLPGRANFVLSRSAGKRIEGARVFGDLDEALKQVKTPDAFIIGGAGLFAESMGKVDGIYLTRIDSDYEGDRSYPIIDKRLMEVSRVKLQDNPLIEVVCYKAI